ncbi:Phosphoglucomutase-2 [Microtus ochrogaster]|uniref:Phosphoglucomutase-2 n=1 Tax=Microtus ochrogaster TaxID=79684 RepID=A0A8J6KXW2_MICOH|nr:Phosphoglucomutase-2 [Microtus ochrogaster]
MAVASVATGTPAPGVSDWGMDAQMDQETAQWLRWDQNLLTLESVKQLIAEGNKEELQKCFVSRMEFGTAGLRAPMGAGNSRMNDLTIIQTTQGFCRSVNKESKEKFVHTSVHGVGHEFVQLAFKAFELAPPEAVPQQKDPDPDFPTVKYPNPEEGRGVLTLSFALADKIKAKIILANDTDADRLAVSEEQDSGEWRVYSGNELGALLGWWLFRSWREKNPDRSTLKDTYMLSSTVSSKMVRAIALK